MRWDHNNVLDGVCQLWVIKGESFAAHLGGQLINEPGVGSLREGWRICFGTPFRAIMVQRLLISANRGRSLLLID